MHSIDVIVSWPRNCDYPLWREFIRKNRTRFNKVIVVFTETNVGYNYREFIQKSMWQDDITFLENPSELSGQDWRDVAVNTGLLESRDSEWIWFTEQDFTPDDKFFFDTVYYEMEDPQTSSIVMMDRERMHPASIFVRREILKKCRRNFGIKPNVADHFYAIQEDLEQLSNKENLFIKVHPMGTYYHMNGLSHNMRLLAEGQEPNYKIEEFTEYVKKCMKVDLPMHDNITALFTKFLQAHS